MSARSTPVVGALLALLVVVPFGSLDAKPRKKVKDPCEWAGEVDPFTKEDKRQRSVSYDDPYPHSYSLGLPREDGAVPVKLSMSWWGYGAGSSLVARLRNPEQWAKAHLLLADGETVIDLVPPQSVAGRTVVSTEEVVRVEWDMAGVWKKDDLRQIARSEGVKMIRLVAVSGEEYTDNYTEKERMKIVEVARCYFERLEEDR